MLSAAAGGTALAAALAARRVLSRHEPGQDGRERRLRATFEVRLETGRPPDGARCPACGRPLDAAESRAGVRHVCAAAPDGAVAPAPPVERGASTPAGSAPEPPGAAETVPPPAAPPSWIADAARVTAATVPTAMRAVPAETQATAGPPPAAGPAPSSEPATPAEAPPSAESTAAAAAAIAAPDFGLEAAVEEPVGGEPAGEHGAIRVDTGSDPVLGRLMEPVEAPVERPAGPAQWRPADSIDTWDEADHAGEPETGQRPAPVDAGTPHATADAPREPLTTLQGAPAGAAAGPAWPAAAESGGPAPRTATGETPWPGALATAPAVPVREPAVATARTADVCAEAEAAVAETCEALDRARDAHAVALERYGPIRRSHADVEHRVAEALRSLDARRVADEKAAAQQRFREARASAASPEAVQAAAAEWLRTLDALNRGIQQASRILPGLREQEQRLAAELAVATTQLDITRIALESADDGCRDAREALATCEEARAAFESSPLARRPERPGPGIGERPAAVGSGREPAPASAPHAPTGIEAGGGPAVRTAPSPEPAGRPRTTTSTPGGLGRRATPSGLRPGGEPSEILRLLRGEQAALDRVAAALSGGSATEAHHWQLELAALADAIIEAALDAAAIDPAQDHPFWGSFSLAERREIVAALASAGFRFDGRQGFVDGRAPSQRDLSLAVGYVGLDPHRARAWPTDAEMASLFRGARVAAAEFLRLRAADLSLGHMAAMLGHRADDLTQLWNAWGRVRPLLLSVSG